MDDQIDRLEDGGAADTALLTRVTKLVNALYDEAIEPSGLAGAQFSCLAALARRPGVTSEELAALLAVPLDELAETTVPLERRGYVATRRRSKRSSSHHLTRTGREKFAEAGDLWRDAQSKVVSILGAREADDLVAALIEIEALLEIERPC